MEFCLTKNRYDILISTSQTAVSLTSGFWYEKNSIRRFGWQINFLKKIIFHPCLWGTRVTLGENCRELNASVLNAMRSRTHLTNFLLEFISINGRALLSCLRECSQARVQLTLIKLDFRSAPIQRIVRRTAKTGHLHQFAAKGRFSFFCFSYCLRS